MKQRQTRRSRRIFPFIFQTCHYEKNDSSKGDYARTRASDSKHLPAVILNIFLCEYTKVMFDIVVLTKRIKFIMFSMNKTFKCYPSIFRKHIKCFVEFKGSNEISRKYLIKCCILQKYTY